MALFDTPSALLAASAASVTAFAGQALSVVTQGDVQQTAAHTVSQASGATTSVYAHQGGIEIIAANGPVSLRAHTDALSILADQTITVTSVNDEIRVGANQEIRLVAGQSSITLKGGDIEFRTPGAFTAHGATHAFEDGGSGVAALPALPDAKLGEPQNWIAIGHADPEGVPMAGQKYKIHFEGGTVITGTLDPAGKARHENVPAKALRTEYEPRTPDKDKPWEALDKLMAAARSKLG